MRTSIEQPIRSGTADSILASLFRHILASYNVTNDRFNSYLERYIVRSNIPRNIKDISSVRGNLKKELTKNTMSWRVFVKGLQFLNFNKFEIIIRLYDPIRKDVYHDHSKMIILDPNDPLDFTPEQSEKE